MHADMVYAYSRDLLERITGVRPEPDQDGDLPVEYGGGLFYVRVVGPTDPLVQVFSVVLADLSPSAELHEALNTVNTQLRFARAFFVQGQVLIESEIWGSDLNPANFEHACRNVAIASDSHGKKLADAFGGTPRFAQSKTSGYRIGFVQ